MTILVTGGAGYIGSHMVLQCVDRGQAVVVLDNLSTGFKSALPDRVPLVVGDVADADLVADVIARHGVTAIAHFAARIVVPESVVDPLGYYRDNTVKSRALIESAIAGGVKHMIFSSTAAVYGEGDGTLITEESPAAPVSPYGRSKLMTEWMLRDAADAHGLRFAALRYFNVAGADPAGRAGQSTPRATHLIKVACQAALGRRAGMEIFGQDFPTKDGSCLRDYIHVADLAKAHMAALDYLRAGGANITLNCAYGQGYSVLEVVEAVKRISGVNFLAERSPRRAGDPARIVATGEKIRAVLRWAPEFDNLDLMIKHALEWERRIAADEFVGEETSSTLLSEV